jgi:membrane associated rhomboid family serine protease
MLSNQSLITRIAVGKLIGFTFGLMGLIFIPYFLPEANWLLRLGILLWYTTVGAVVAIFGALNFHPVFKVSLPWWLLSPLIGAWMNFVLTFFAYDAMQPMLAVLFGQNGILSSPFWFAAEGAVIGLMIGFFAMQFDDQASEPYSK